jgi:hypothetical protein
MPGGLHAGVIFAGLEDLYEIGRIKKAIAVGISREGRGTRRNINRRQGAETCRVQTNTPLQ